MGDSTIARTPCHKGELTVTTTQVWGPPLVAKTDVLTVCIRDLQEELVALASDVRRGPLAALHAEGVAYLGELRREFLRAHRRLSLGLKGDDREHVLDLLRTEVADLNERLRAVVLGRSSRMSQGGWKPSALLGALTRTTEVLPEHTVAEIEDVTLATDPTDPVGRAMVRALVRWRVSFSRFFDGQPHRVVDLQSLARFHLSGMELERIEGLTALFVQAEAQLVGHSRLILDGMARGLDTVRDHIEDENLQDILTTFRQQVEEEFQLAEVELLRLADDGGRRAAKLLGEGLRRLKADVPKAGTFELPQRRRRPQRVLATQSMALEDLEGRMGRVRQSISDSYVLLGLHLEYASFRGRVRVALGRQLAELKKDVRGRSHTQIERVIAALQETREHIEAIAASTDETLDIAALEPSEADLRSCLQPLERVLSDALRNTNQLLEQLTEEQLVAPLLEALNREAQTLTDRYEVPAGKLAHAEWRLPSPLSRVEVRLAEFVTARIQTDVAPELLRATQAAVGAIEPVVSAFHDLERIVSIDAEVFSADIEVGEGGDAPDDLREVAKAALGRSQAALVEVLQRSDSWSQDLVGRLKQIVFTGVDSWRERLSEAQVGRLRTGRGRGVGAPAALTRHVDRLTGALNNLGDDSIRKVRNLVGERRLQEWRRQLGLPNPPLAPDHVERLLAAPQATKEIPLYYRRLFAPNAHWAGDLSAHQRKATERIKSTLSRSGGQGLRTAAVLSVEGAGQGALLASLTRGQSFGQIRKVSFSRPVDVAEVDDLFGSLGHGQLMVVGGFRWLLSAGPNGFAPLRCFLSGILTDNGKNAWLIEAPSLVWQFALRVAPVSEVFKDRIEVGPLTAPELQSALAARHQLSGMKLQFSEDSAEQHLELVAKERFFNALHHVSGGYLIRALPIWLAAIEDVREDSDCVAMGAPGVSPIPALERLDDETCVILLAILRQGWMDKTTLAHLFRWAGVQAQGRLMRLVADGLLEQKSGGLFQVKRHLRHGVRQVLRDKKWCP